MLDVRPTLVSLHHIVCVFDGGGPYVSDLFRCFAFFWHRRNDGRFSLFSHIGAGQLEYEMLISRIADWGDNHA